MVIEVSAKERLPENIFLVVVVLVKFEVFLAISDNGTLGCEQRRL